MSLFDNISKKVSETAKAAARKSGDIVEVTKLNMNIGAEEDKIKRVYSDMGRIVYESYSGDEEIPENLKALCEKVDTYHKNIEEMKQKILELRHIKACPACGMELGMEMTFCFKCGEKQPVVQVQEEQCEEKCCECEEEDKEQ